ncbi:MAG: CoA pyrophosphatase [Microscillaceae bacterium]|nr:CoA pyrophosphatase [Microscillaceae bacterium]
MVRTTAHDTLISHLQQKLEAPLPGPEAHWQMAPMQRREMAEKYQPNAQTKVSSVLLLLYPEGDRLHFPMIVRPENSGVHSGQVALPGGKKDEEDEDLIETALRETWEELGVRVLRSQVLGQLSHLYIPPSNFLVFPAIAILPEKPVFSPSVYEVAEMLTVDLHDFIDRNPRTVREITARYMRAEVPCFDLGGKVVWGATAMILSELYCILAEHEVSR